MLNLDLRYVLARKVQVNAEEGAVDPPKVEEKIGAVPNGLQTDSDVVKRLVGFCFRICLFVNF